MPPCTTSTKIYVRRLTIPEFESIYNTADSVLEWQAVPGSGGVGTDIIAVFEHEPVEEED